MMTFKDLKQEVLRYSPVNLNLTYSSLSDNFYLYDEDNQLLATFQADNWDSLQNQYRTYFGIVEHNDSNLPLMRFITFDDPDPEFYEFPITISRQLKMLNGAIGFCYLNDESADYLKMIMDMKRGKNYNADFDVKAGETYTISFSTNRYSGDDVTTDYSFGILDYSDSVQTFDVSIKATRPNKEPWEIKIDNITFEPNKDGKMRIGIRCVLNDYGISADISKQVLGTVTIKDSAGNVVVTID